MGVFQRLWLAAIAGTGVKPSAFAAAAQQGATGQPTQTLGPLATGPGYNEGGYLVAGLAQPTNSAFVGPAVGRWGGLQSLGPPMQIAPEFGGANTPYTAMFGFSGMPASYNNKVITETHSENGAGYAISSPTVQQPPLAYDPTFINFLYPDGSSS